MGPSIILDKSVLQALSFAEICALREFYIPIVVPVLTIEVLADLKKPTKGALSEDKVAVLAKKVRICEGPVNVHYSSAVGGSLLGYDVPMDRRPILPGGKAVLTSEEEKGIVFEQSPEEQALLRWDEGQFSAAEGGEKGHTI